MYFPKTATELTQLTITIGTPAFQAKFENTRFQEVPNDILFWTSSDFCHTATEYRRAMVANPDALE